MVDQLSSDVTEAIILAEQEPSQEAYQRVFELESRLADLTHASTSEGIAARLGTVSAAREAGKPVMALVNAKWFLLDPELPPCARQRLEMACKELLVELAP